MDSVQTFTGFLFDMAAKSTLLLILACLAARLLRHSSAAVRHSLWSLTLSSLVLLPVATCTLPALSVPILPVTEEDAQAASSPVLVETPASSADLDRDFKANQSVASPKDDHDGNSSNVSATSTVDSTEQPVAPVVANRTAPVASRRVNSETRDELSQSTPVDSMALTVVVGWSLGVGLFSMVVAVGIWRVARLRRLSVPVTGGVWRQLLVELHERLQLRRSVDLREHAESIVPLTCGVLRSVVLVPRQAHAWHESLQRSVLIHELAHVQRRDVLFQLIGRLACTLYWFHPLAWYAFRRLRQEGEHACDDAVVRSGERASHYAEQLLEVARQCCGPSGTSLGVAMAEGSNLELRVQSLFDSDRQHGPVRKLTGMALLLVCGVILTVTAAVSPVSATAQATPQEEREVVVTTRTRPTETTVAAEAADSTEKASNPKWRRGTDALQRIIDLRPVFGSEQGGLKLGLTFATPQRVFHVGERIPVELFLINVSDKEVTTRFVINFLFDTPHVEDSKGKRIPIPRLATFMKRPRHTVTLQPGEAVGIPAIGLGLGEVGPVSFEAPTVGKYRFTYRLAGLTSGPLEFEAVEEEPGKLRINASYTPLNSPERTGIIKPEFGEARRGIQLGLAFPTLQRSFAIGQKIPLEVFVRNIGEGETSVQFHPDMYWSPASVVNSSGEDLRITPMPLWLLEPSVNVTLKPGQSYGTPTPGFQVTESRTGLSLVAPDPGKYRLQLIRHVSGDVQNPDAWQEELKTDTLSFEVLEDEEGQRSVRLLVAENDQTPTPAAVTKAVRKREPGEAQPAETSKIPLEDVIWWEKVQGLQAGFLLDSPGRPNHRVPLDSVVKYRVLLRNTTDQKMTFMARPVPVDFRDAPYLIPSDNIVDALNSPTLPVRFRAERGRQGWKYQLAYEMTLEPGESAVIPAHRGGDVLGLHVGDDDAGELPTIATVKAGMNWIVQPLQVWLSTEPGYGTGGLFEGLYFQTRVDREGRAKSEPATRCEVTDGGTVLHPRIQLEVGTLNAASVRNAEHATWGKVDKGLQCGIRLLNPKKSFATGDTLKAELLWRNTSDEVVNSPRPRRLDLYPMLHNDTGDSLLIDFGARFRIIPIWHEFQPGEVCSLGVFQITLVPDGTPSPGNNAEPGHITLQPGTYYLSGSGGVSSPDGGSPRSGRIRFEVANAPAPARLEELRKAAADRVRALGGDVSPYDKTSVAVDLFQTKATDGDLETIRCFDLVALTLTGTQITDAGLRHLQDMQRLGDLGLHNTRVSDEGLARLSDLRSLESLNLGSTDVTDAGLKHLKSSLKLYLLSLENTRVTDSGLVPLSELPGLRTLILDRTSVTDQGVAHLGRLETLNDLRLGSTKISDAGLEHLADIPQLRTLVLSDTTITGAGLKHLPSSVKTLWLPGTKLNDDGLQGIQHLANLESLILTRTDVTDAGLRHLEKLDSLRDVQLQETAVTAAGAARLQLRLPKCRVTR